MAFQDVDISRLRVDGGTQTRAKMDNESVKAYAVAQGKGDKRPDHDPIVAFDDGKVLWLASGFHWVAGARLAGVKTLRVDVQKGDMRDALLFSAGCNLKHGAQLTPADKRHKLKLLLADKDWAKCSDNWIAQKAGTSPHLVAEVRKELNGGQKDTSPRTGKDGRQRPAAGSKAKQKAKPSNGRAAFDWKGFERDYGLVVRQLDTFTASFSLAKNAEAAGLRRLLNEFHKGLETLLKKAQKERNPKGT